MGTQPQELQKPKPQQPQQPQQKMQMLPPPSPVPPLKRVSKAPSTVNQIKTPSVVASPEASRSSACQPESSMAWTPTRRLRGKQSPPHSAQKTKQKSQIQNVSDVVEKEQTSVLSAASKSEASVLPKTGCIQRPSEFGARVIVLGDGWGAGTGGYPAVVTDAD